MTRLVPSFHGLVARLAERRSSHVWGALVCAELAAVYPQTGRRLYFSEAHFFPGALGLMGWAMFWSIHSGIIAAIAVNSWRAMSATLCRSARRASARWPSARYCCYRASNYLGVKTRQLAAIDATIASSGDRRDGVSLLFVR